MGKVIQFKKPEIRYVDIHDTGPLKELRPAAKSSTSVLQASVCQSCGCKLDGKVETMKKGCKCRCHVEGAR